MTLLKLVVFLLPLGLDPFTIAALLGAVGLTLQRQRTARRLTLR